MTNVQPRDDHDWLSPDYVDDWVGDWSARPERAAQLRRVAVALPFRRDEQIKVLDVGGGWGPLTEQVLSNRPDAKVTLLDFSQPMLDHASRRFASANMDVQLFQRDLSDAAWVAGLDGPYDAVVSSLAIHNLREPDTITRIYNEIYGLVREGGCFLNLEIVVATGPRLAGIAQRIRADDAGTDPDDVQLPTTNPRAPRATGTEADTVAPRSLESQLRWLGSAGFSEVDCLWKNANLALLAALR